MSPHLVCINSMAPGRRLLAQRFQCNARLLHRRQHPALWQLFSDSCQVPLPSLRKWPDKILKTDFFAPVICLAPPSLRAEAVLVLRLVPFLLRAMFQLWFAPRFSSRLGLIGIRTLAARWRGHSRCPRSRHERGAGILVPFFSALLSGALCAALDRHIGRGVF